MTITPLWIPAALVVVAGALTYTVLQWDSKDKDAPHRRILLWLSTALYQPTVISGQKADTSPDLVKLDVIVFRPADVSRVQAGRRKMPGASYNPQPHGSSMWDVADDREHFVDFYSWLKSERSDTSQ